MRVSLFVVRIIIVIRISGRKTRKGGKYIIVAQHTSSHHPTKYKRGERRRRRCWRKSIRPEGVKHTAAITQVC
jgi:hypothetical protein